MNDISINIENISMQIAEYMCEVNLSVVVDYGDQCDI